MGLLASGAEEMQSNNFPTFFAKAPLWGVGGLETRLGTPREIPVVQHTLQYKIVS